MKSLLSCPSGRERANCYRRCSPSPSAESIKSPSQYKRGSRVQVRARQCQVGSVEGVEGVEGVHARVAHVSVETRNVAGNKEWEKECACAYMLRLRARAFRTGGEGRPRRRGRPCQRYRIHLRWPRAWAAWLPSRVPLEPWRCCSRRCPGGTSTSPLSNPCWEPAVAGQPGGRRQTAPAPWFAPAPGQAAESAGALREWAVSCGRLGCGGGALPFRGCGPRGTGAR
jgi:hypothetical protein